MDRNRLAMGLLLVSALLLVPGLGAVAQESTPAADHGDIEIDYVLHGLNAFTERITTGAEDAGRDYGVTVNVFADPDFEVATHQAFFASSLERGVDGIAVIPSPAPLWIAPLHQAADQGIPVVGANIAAPDLPLTTWVGQDEYNSGILLGQEMLAQLAAAGISEGTVVVGICIPAADVLLARDLGVRRAFAGSGFAVLGAQEVLMAIPENAGRWEAIMAASPDAVAAIGLCSIDTPNLAALKTRTRADWLIGGYVLDPLTLQAIQDGVVQVAVDQQEYLQGYLPVALLAEHVINGRPLAEGWFETPTEIVTIANVDEHIARQVDDQVQYDFYQRYMDETYGDPRQPTRPDADLVIPGMASPTP